MTITKDDVLRVTREIVAEYGEDYVYPNANLSCVYVERGAPSCLLGHIAFRLDPELYESTREIDRFGRDHNNLNDAQAFRLALGLDSTNDKIKVNDQGEPLDAVDVLFRAQAAQDGGLSWGYCLKLIENRITDVD
jgi:hypothetical protein